MTGNKLLKNAPNWVIAVCATVGFIAVVAAFVILAVTGGDSTELVKFLGMVFSGAGAVFGGGAFIAAGAAAKSAGKAEEQTNGVLDQRIQNAINQALARQSRSANAAAQATYEKGVSDGRPTV